MGEDILFVFLMGEVGRKIFLHANWPNRFLLVGDAGALADADAGGDDDDDVDDDLSIVSDLAALADLLNRV